MRVAFSFAFGFLFATLTAAPLAAQTSPTEKAAARALANEGDAALKKKDYATAFDKYDKAVRLVPEALTLTLGIARAQLGLGKLVEAREAYNTVVRTALQPGAPPAYKAAKTEAEQEITGIDTRIGSLVITVEGPRAPTVTVDGLPVPGLLLGERRPTNPGEHLVRATAPGYRPAEERVVVKEGSKTETKLVLSPDTPTASPAVEAPPAAAPATAPPPPPPSGSGLRTGAWIAAGVGVGGLAVGGLFGYLAYDKHQGLQDDCPAKRCPSNKGGDLDGFRSRATVSTIGFVVAGVGAAITIPLFVVSKPGSPESATTAVVLSPSSVAFAGSF